jgi:hypothetical protein
MLIHRISIALAASLVTACTGTIDGSLPVEPEPPAHAGSDPWADLDRLQREGPPRYASRVHSCPKVRYATLGNLMTSRGVDLAATAPLSAGAIYRGGAGALGGPNYAALAREDLEAGLATASKNFDIFVQAAPEIIANLPRRPECQRAGTGVTLFDGAGRCVADGISCLLGVPATPDHVAICNETVTRAADPVSGQRLAVAVLAAAAHTCE